MLRLPPPELAVRGPNDPRGLIVTGTHSRCGKTVLCAGLAGVLRELGFQVQAIKPMAFLPPTDLRKGYEQLYFDRLMPSTPQGSQVMQSVEGFSCESPYVVGIAEWRRLISLCQKRVYPYILESPGSLSTPLRIGEETLDMLDLAEALALPVLLAVQRNDDILATLPPALAYAAYRRIPLIGWVAVQTQPSAPSLIPFSTWQEDLLYLSRFCNAPYLGEIPYSPSISVEATRQGNLFRLTETGVDLLPIQQALDVSIPL